MSIGIIGTGMLGEAVGIRLLESGYKVIAHNRTLTKTQNLASKGARIVDSPSTVAKNSEIVITCVKDSIALKHVSFEEEKGIIHGYHKGLIIADMSTINPNHSKEIAKKFQERSITMLEVPVMGGPNMAVDGKLIMMASGDKTAYEKYKEIFQVLAHKIFYLGSNNGTAHTVKLAMNIQIAMLALAISEGITFVKRSGIDPTVFLEVLNSTYFKTGMSQNKAFKMIKGDYRPTFLLKNLRKDLYTIDESAKSLGLHLPMSIMAKEIYQKAVKTGFGDLDYTGILAYLEEEKDRTS